MNELDNWMVETRALNPDAWVPNLKGQIVGNGFTDWKYDGFPAYFEMAYYHGLIDDELYDFGSRKCNFSYIELTGSQDLIKGCRDSIKTFLDYTKYVNIWNIYDKCHKNQPIPCVWSQPVVDFFNSTKVKEQLNILPELRGKSWQACDYETVRYNESIEGSVGLYPKLRSKYRLLFYSGDNDSIVPTQGTQQWINALGWTITDEWRPYFFKNSATTKQIVGYIEERGNFTLATVHNAGHQAAKNRRREVQALVNAFVNSQKIELLVQV